MEPTPHLLTSVLVACDAKLLGQPELIVVVQDFVLPLVDLGPTVALRVGGTRLLSLWLEAAALHGAGIDEYTGAALFAAIQQSGVAFLDRALQARVHRDMWTSVANYAVRNRDRTLIEALYERLPKLKAPYALEIAAAVGDLELVKWIHERRFGGSAVTEKTMSRAATKAHMDVLQWCLEIDGLPNKPTLVRRAMDYAARYGQFDVLRWLHEHTDYWWSQHAIGAALTNGHFELADWMFDQNQERLATCTLPMHDPSYPILDTTMVKLEAFVKGDLRVLEWLREREQLLSVTRQLVERAMIAGHVHVLQYVAQHFTDSQSKGTLRFTPACAAGGSIPVAEWAMAHGSRKDDRWCGSLINTATVIFVAAKHGRIDFIRWYWAVFQGHVQPSYDGHVRDALEIAAEKGHFECVRFLVENDYSTVSSTAAIKAARHGYLGIVQYLTDLLLVAEAAREEVNEEGSPRDERAASVPGWMRAAINEAAIHGHLEVVKWIFDLQPLQFDPSTLTRAAGNDHVDMVRFLTRHLSECEHEQAMYEAASQGHLRVLKYLLSHFPQSRRVCDSLTHHARRHGHAHVAKWIEKYGCKSNEA